MPAPAFRCDRCVDRVARCKSCRERRAESVRATRARKRAAGICLQCPRFALPGQVRCEVHRRENNQLSGESHHAAVVERGGRTR